MSRRFRLPKHAASAESQPLAPFDPEPIEALLQDAVLEVIDGSPPGPLFATRVQRVCLQALGRAGISAEVHTDATGQQVTVRVRRGRRVERIVVQVGLR